MCLEVSGHVTCGRILAAKSVANPFAYEEYRKESNSPEN